LINWTWPLVRLGYSFLDYPGVVFGKGPVLLHILILPKILFGDFFPLRFPSLFSNWNFVKKFPKNFGEVEFLIWELKNYFRGHRDTPFFRD